MTNKKLDISKTVLTPTQADHLICAAKGANEALHQLEALTQALINESKESGSETLQLLAKIGNFHAMDQANITDCMIESLELGEVA